MAMPNLKFDAKIGLGTILQAAILLVAVTIAWGDLKADVATLTKSAETSTVKVRSEMALIESRLDGTDNLLTQQLTQIVEVLGEIKAELKELRR
jgi:hypothetical protein